MRFLVKKREDDYTNLTNQKTLEVPTCWYLEDPRGTRYGTCLILERTVPVWYLEGTVPVWYLEDSRGTYERNPLTRSCRVLS